MEPLRLGRQGHSPLSFRFEHIAEPLRLFLINADESCSMGGREKDNVGAYKTIAEVVGGRADLVVLHAFESDSRYELLIAPRARENLDLAAVSAFRRVTVEEVKGPRQAIQRGEERLAAHRASGSTNPRSHAEFLTLLLAALEAFEGEVDLVVVNSSDGGFDGGASSPTTAAIHAAMRRLNARCRNQLAANVLVGSAGSPAALTFFTGDPDRYDSRLLFSTVRASEGVLKLGEVLPDSLTLPADGAPRWTVTPALPIWAVVDGELVTWVPEGETLPPSVIVRQHSPIAGGRALVQRAEVRLDLKDITLDAGAQALFTLIAQAFSDNPYLRESSRASINGMLAPLERLLTTRSAVLAMLVASPEAQAAVEALRAAIGENSAQIRAALATLTGQPRALSARLNALNTERHALKEKLREQTKEMEQATLDRELGFYKAHPNHWLVWLQPAIEALKAQLELTQADPGDKIAHLSTRIRTAKSVADGQSCAADRYLDRLLAESRARRDRRDRQADPRDQEPFEQPGRWTEACCPLTGRLLTEGLAAIPFVADRSDLTSGNLMAGGQNVDRIPVDRQPLLSMNAVRDLTWGELGQMASPWVTAEGAYNAAIPLLLGPATPASMRQLEAAIGWLCSGTSAFGPQMAEALPGALVSLLGPPSDQADHHPATQGLLRTLPLLERFSSYPYAPGTAALDESAPKAPLPVVWGRSVREAADAACLQSFGCITSFFARALCADAVDAYQVTLDLFSWGCRNLARSVLSTPSEDGRGGLEGLLRLAALFGSAVELEGHPLGALDEPTQTRSRARLLDQSTLDEAALTHVLGPTLLSHWGPLSPLPVSDFTAALNHRLAAAPPEALADWLGELTGLFARLDALRDQAHGAPLAAPPHPGVTLLHVTHTGFDLSRLDALRPRRYATPVPRLTSVLAQLRRRTFAGETRWVPPRNSGTRSLSTSAWSFLESHSAMYPLRAWLRLRQIGRFGQPALRLLREGFGKGPAQFSFLPALRALREAATLEPIPPIGPLVPTLDSLIGADSMMTLLRRAFAFVAANANGYADSQWATSPLRTAGATKVDAILGPLPAPQAIPRRYTATDVFDRRDADHDWPRTDARGYLPKRRAVDSRGDTLFTISLPLTERQGTDAEVVSRAALRLITHLTESGVDDHVLHGLHRQARAALGDYPVDLSTLSEAERDRLIINELVPRVAGKVKGDTEHPLYFTDLAVVLHQLCRLGTDTRLLRGAEPVEVLAAEAAALRAEPG